MTGEHEAFDEAFDESVRWARDIIDQVAAVTRGQRVDRRYCTPEQLDAIELLAIRLAFVHARHRLYNAAVSDARRPDPDTVLRLWRNRVLDAGTGDLVDALAEAIRQRDAARALLACQEPGDRGGGG